METNHQRNKKSKREELSTISEGDKTHCYAWRISNLRTGIRNIDV